MTANEDDGTIDAECEWDGGGYHALATGSPSKPDLGTETSAVDSGMS